MNKEILTNGSSFSQYRNFSFHQLAIGPENNSSSNRHPRTHFSKQANCDDVWTDLGLGQCLKNGFIKKVPDIHWTPETVISEPYRTLKDTKRFELENRCTNDISKLEYLFQIQDHVYRVRWEPFHWNIRDSAEKEFVSHTISVNFKVLDGPAMVAAMLMYATFWKVKTRLKVWKDTNTTPTVSLLSREILILIRSGLCNVLGECEMCVDTNWVWSLAWMFTGTSCRTGQSRWRQSTFLPTSQKSRVVDNIQQRMWYMKGQIC